MVDDVPIPPSCSTLTPSAPFGQYCDIQPIVQSPATKVPVCMPVQPCNLANPLCPPSETCAVVRPETGATSCVPVGSAGPSQSCDKDHCQQGLMCLGAPGQRTCYVLCHTKTSAECTATHQTCMTTLPLFLNPETGVCQ
jgi:hypothetical protein